MFHCRTADVHIKRAKRAHKSGAFLKGSGHDCIGGANGQFFSVLEFLRIFLNKYFKVVKFEAHCGLTDAYCVVKV